MKKMLLIALAAFAAFSFKGDDGIITIKEDGTAVVNTTDICPKVYGYADTTPLLIYIKAGEVQGIEFLENWESPEYFKKVQKGLATAWDGVKVKDVAKLKVDAVSGATFSSNAVIENVRKGVAYYIENQ